MTGDTFSDLVKIVVGVIFGGGGIGVFQAIRQAVRERKTDAQAEADRPMAFSQNVTELTNLLQIAAEKSVQIAMADLQRARIELNEARQAMDAQERQHRQTVDWLMRRIEQLVDVLRFNNLPVPPEEPKPHE